MVDLRGGVHGEVSNGTIMEESGEEGRACGEE